MKSVGFAKPYSFDEHFNCVAQGSFVVSLNSLTPVPQFISVFLLSQWDTTEMIIINEHTMQTIAVMMTKGQLLCNILPCLSIGLGPVFSQASLATRF